MRIILLGIKITYLFILYTFCALRPNSEVNYIYFGGTVGVVLLIYQQPCSSAVFYAVYTPWDAEVA